MEGKKCSQKKHHRIRTREEIRREISVKTKGEQDSKHVDINIIQRERDLGTTQAEVNHNADFNSDLSR